MYNIEKRRKLRLLIFPIIICTVYNLWKYILCAHFSLKNFACYFFSFSDTKWILNHSEGKLPKMMAAHRRLDEISWVLTVELISMRCWNSQNKMWFDGFSSNSRPKKWEIFIKGLVALCHSFLYFIIFILTIILSSLNLHHSPGPVFLYLRRSFAQQEKNLYGVLSWEIELGPALQQADALPIELSRTPTLNA